MDYHQQKQRPAAGKGRKRMLEEEEVASTEVVVVGGEEEPAAAAAAGGGAGASASVATPEWEALAAQLYHRLREEGEVELVFDDGIGIDVQIAALVEALNGSFSWDPSDRLAARRVAYVLVQLIKEAEGFAKGIATGGGIPALVRHLEAPPPPWEGAKEFDRAYEHEVESLAATALGQLALKPEYQQLIVDFGALPPLVNLLKRIWDGSNTESVKTAALTATETIANLAHDNNNVKTFVRLDGGIPPLVELLEFDDLKVQKAAAGALRILAFKNDENKKQIVDCNALPVLVLMLQCDDPTIHGEAIGVIGNLVHSSPSIKKEVLLAGALQPVIRLLSSTCIESQKEAALLIGQFAGTDSDLKVHIVQRGAVQPLLSMLQSPDVHLREMASFALGRLAQDLHNQVGIVYAGAIPPLLKLLGSKYVSLQHNAAFALYGLVDSEDNIVDFVKAGGVQKLQEGEFIFQATKDCVAKTMKKVEEKIRGMVLKHLLYIMNTSEQATQIRIALSLAHLCSPEDVTRIFIDSTGLDILLNLLGSANINQQREGCVALYRLAKKAMQLSPAESAPTSPAPKIYLGDQYVNNPTLSDVTFIVEDKKFYAHRIALLASSDTFRAMFDGGYREREANDVNIPNIKWEIFDLMMRFVYTGSVKVNQDVAQDLLRAADQYLLEDLKLQCEYAIAQDISLENITSMYDLSEAFNADTLRYSCIMFVLVNFEEIQSRLWNYSLIQRVKSDYPKFFTKAFMAKISASLTKYQTSIG